MIFFATVHRGSINSINNGETCGCESHNDREHNTYNSETLFIIKHADKIVTIRLLDHSDLNYFSSRLFNLERYSKIFPSTGCDFHYGSEV